MVAGKLLVGLRWALLSAWWSGTKVLPLRGTPTAGEAVPSKATPAVSGAQGGLPGPPTAGSEGRQSNPEARADPRGPLWAQVACAELRRWLWQ